MPDRGDRYGQEVFASHPDLIDTAWAKRCRRANEIREPLADLRTDWTHLRTWRDPRAALIHHLSDDPITRDDYPFSANGGWPAVPNVQSPTPVPQQLAAGERPPIDPDAT